MNTETILSYRGFGLKGQDIIRVRYGSEGVGVHIRTRDKCVKRSGCGSKAVTKKGYTERSYLTTPIGLNSVHLVAQVQRLQCKDCGLVRQEKLSYADPKKSYTYKLEEYINDLLENMTRQEVARKLGMSWNTIKDTERRCSAAKNTRYQA